MVCFTLFIYLLILAMEYFTAHKFHSLKTWQPVVQYGQRDSGALYRSRMNCLWQHFGKNIPPSGGIGYR